MSWNFVAFFVSISFFHLSEFALALVFMRNNVSISSLLFSKPYCIAMLGSLMEYLIEDFFFPNLKRQAGVIALTGLALVIIGEGIRKAALFTAKTNFTHVIRTEKSEGHSLVTHGIYRYVRHPGYLGWFLWCVGTQVLLVNPVALPVFCYAAWAFFNTRIKYEERLLRKFFGDAYVAYAAKTPTYIPLIR